jgi:hypothetical protein
MCPWEQFKEIALQSIDVSCIQQPLKGSIESMLGLSSSDDDYDAGYADWKVILVTISVCLVVFVGLAFLCFRQYKKGVDANKSILSSALDPAGQI